ncbi:MAG TPA: hypothetical protein VME67_02160 [Mycobacterium sp.]|nr:hypothetical protein [Mycobacterium sp.]HTX93733.1 hypothetical protein [Mycobacterium sp.]
MQLATGWLFSYVDGALTRAEQVYEVEREAWLRSAAATRAATIDDVLSERERDAQRAAQKLRCDINREHVAVGLWFESVPAEGEAQRVLTAACAALARATSAENTLRKSEPGAGGEATHTTSQHRQLTRNQAEAILGRSVDTDAFEITVAPTLLPLLPGMANEL